MIDGNVEEALDLVLVEVDAHHTVGACGHDDVGGELGADGDAGLVLAVLPRVAVVRHHRRHPRRRRALRRVDQEQQLHDVVRGRDGRLDDEDIPASRVLVDPHEDLAVSEILDRRAVCGGIEFCRDFFGERPICAASEQEERSALVCVVHGPRDRSQNDSLVS